MTQLTSMLIAREMCAIVGNNLELEFKETLPLAPTQTYVDFILDAIDLSKSIEFISEAILMPVALALVDKLNKGNARYCYQLPMARAYECNRVLYNGISLRCLVDRNYETLDKDGSPKLTNLFKFDILWSN
jgi:hypothetical protein